MAKSLQDRIKAKQQKKFVGRDQHVQLFQSNLNSDDPMILFNIFGQGGVGKTYLSRQYKELAEANNCLTAYSDETTTSVLHWMEQVAKQFKEQDAELSDFDKHYKKYQQETKRLEADPDKPKGTFGNVVRSVSKGLIKEAEKVPGVELASSFVDKDGLANALGDWADFVAKKITNKDEVELILEPIKVLSPLFWKDISKVADKKTAICFFIDTFEESDSILETWLLESLVEKHGEISPNSQFIIAGRDELDPNRWSAYYELTQPISLEPFTDTEMELFFAHHSIMDDAMKADIRRLTNGLPVLVAWLCEAAKTGKGSLQDAADTAVERFLKWVVDEKQRNIALEAALARRINQDIIECLLSDAKESKAYFDWLIKQPFTLKRGDAWAYHNVVREQMMRYIRSKSPKQWAACHEKLSTYYQNLQNDLALSEEDTFLHDKWLAYEAERLYHALCAKPDKNMAQGIENFVTLWDNSSWDKSIIFGEILKEAGENTEHELCKGWGLRIIAAIEESNNDNELPLQQLCEDILTKCLVQKNNNKASLYFQIAWVNYEIHKNYDLAIAQYQKAIEINPDDAIAYYNLGNIYAIHKQDYDFAIAQYQKAIELKPDYAEAYFNLGYIYQINKQDYDLAIEHYQKAIEIMPDFAMAYYNLGYIYQNNKQDYDFAIAQYQKAIEIKPDFANAYFNLGLIYQNNKQDYDLAIAQFQKGIEIKPNEARAYFDLGLIYQNNIQDYDLAIAQYQKAIEIKPDFANAYNNLGTIYQTHKQDYDLAIVQYQKAIEIKPDFAEAYNNLGTIYQTHKQDYDHAIAQYQKAIEIQPDYADAYFQLGYIYQNHKQDYDHAIAQYQKAIEIKPDFANAYFNLGLIYQNNKQDYDLAIAQYQKAIEIKPDFANAYNNLGTIYQTHKQDYDLAIVQYQKAIEIKPDFAEAYFNLGLTYQTHKQEYVLAIAQFQKGIEINPNEARAYFDLGLIYQNNIQEFDLAIAQYQKAIENKPDYASAYYQLGQIYQYDKQAYDLAIELYQKAIEIKPDDADAYYNLGQIYNHNKQDYDLAIAQYQKAIEIKPDFANAYNNLGTIYQTHKQDYDLAIVQYQKAIEIKPDFAEAYFNLGQIYNYNKQDYDLAIAQYQKAIEIKPDDADAYDNLGNVYAKLKDYSKAIAYYQKATEIEPENISFVGSWGFTLLQNGELEEAETILIKAIALGNIKYSNMNLGHVLFVKGKQAEAIVCYLKSHAAFEDKAEFWAGMQDDFQYLEQYNITATQYEALFNEIKTYIEKE